MEYVNMTLGYKDLKFDGIKFREDKSKYPWKTNKEADKVFNDLVEEGSEYSQIKYKKLMQLQYDEDIHVKLSYSLMSEYASYALMGIVFGLAYLMILIPSLICLGLSIASFILHKYLNRKVAELYMFKEMNSAMVGILFTKEELKLELE